MDYNGVFGGFFKVVNCVGEIDFFDFFVVMNVIGEYGVCVGLFMFGNSFW